MDNLPQTEEALPMTREETEALVASVAKQLEARIAAAALEKETAEAAREEALAERERTLDRREMIAKTAEALKARGLPESLAEAMPLADESAVTKAVNDLEIVFRQGVQAGVEERLKGEAPKSAPAKPLSDLTDKEYYAAISRL